ncbi:MAG: tRNA lysidine(34) synthetase TilS [Clostridia bacterium]|nr:tRNA lysidine(34) synthetase TilS [Clostridia bacterium]
MTGLYGDFNKIPKTAVIRTKKDGDVFKKFGGGTKKLADYFTDVKIPLRLRDEIPLLCDKNEVLVVFGKAVSDKIKVDETTEKIIKFTYED